MSNIAADVQVIDADTHLTPEPDLWSSRAPKGYEDRVLRVVEKEGQKRFVGLPEITYPKNGKTERRPLLEARRAALEQIKDAILEEFGRR